MASYTVDLGNRQHFSHYKESEQWIDKGRLDFDDEMKPFFRCLCDCELVGLDRKEKYMPHRVAMQFGMDQHIPCEFSCVEVKREKFSVSTSRLGLSSPVFR